MREVCLLVVGLFVGDLLYFFRLGRRIEVWFTAVANRRTLAVVICAAASMLPRLAAVEWLRPPEPIIPDEFSFVLGAQTFALGRITNPVHPFWQHFESFHINLVPSYQTMYPPAPSLFLTIGVVLANHPWWGVWLSCGLMCGAICWALQPLIRPKYALLAGMYCGLKYGMFTQYGDSYWGGSVSALGAAITLGAYARLVRTNRPAYIAVLAVGVALLANSRPFEGFLFAVPVATALLVWIHRTRSYIRVLLPTAALVGIVAAATGYYNYRSTGSPTLMPYIANYHQYHFVRPFIGTGMSEEPKYRHYQMAKLFETWEGRPGELSRTREGIEFLTQNKYKFYYVEHFAPLMILALTGLGYALWSRRHNILTSTFLLVWLGLFAVVWWPLSSYPAPLLVSFLGLAFLGIRYLRALRLRGHKPGYYWARGLVLVLLIASLMSYHERFQLGKRLQWSFPAPWNIERQRIIHHLQNSGGNHLLIVKYSRGLHVPHQEWVYNAPDIDSQRVVFAQSLGSPADCRLMAYFSQRKIWYLYPDGAPWPQLVPVDASSVDCNEKQSPPLHLALVRK
ncbi:MAG TPA: hypothetical protein VD837_00855 [Terriglobales bacterium]|nr:hypothetical protein [Terriglobales bacterium]